MTELQKSYLVGAIRGGLSVYRSIAIVNTGLVAKDSPGQIYAIQACNLNATVRYLKIYDKATAATEADTPVLTIALPAGTLPQFAIPQGIKFTTGISVRVTTGLADNDNGAPTAGETILNIAYA